MNFTREELFDLQCAIAAHMTYILQESELSGSRAVKEAYDEHVSRLLNLRNKVAYPERRGV